MLFTLACMAVLQLTGYEASTAVHEKYIEPLFSIGKSVTPNVIEKRIWQTLGLFTRERITVSEHDSALSWFESLILPFVNTKLTKGILDRDPSRKSDSRTCERKALSERDSCVCILEMHAETMHGSISADCTVGTKYYLAVRRSCSWLGRCLRCMWTHVVQITIPITKLIAIWNIFRNVIHSFVNTATITKKNCLLSENALRESHTVYMVIFVVVANIQYL